MIHHAPIVQHALLDLIEATNDAILITSADEVDRPGPRIVHANSAFCRISGYSRDEVIGKSPRFLQGPGTCHVALGRIAAAIRAGQECQEELLNYAKDGTPYWLDIHIVPLHDDTGAIRYFGAIERDITEKRSALEQLKRLALEDMLTGIGNRAALQMHMDGLAEQPDAATRKPFLLLFDLDGFKQINDTLGHLAGDEILRHFAGYVASRLRRDDFMARLGGDEFVAVLKGYTRESAHLFAEHVVANLATMPVRGADQIGVSVGMMEFTPGARMETVLAGADIALYRAKHAGRGVVRVYSQKNVA